MNWRHSGRLRSASEMIDLLTPAVPMGQVLQETPVFLPFLWVLVSFSGLESVVIGSWPGRLRCEAEPAFVGVAELLRPAGATARRRPQTSRLGEGRQTDVDFSLDAPNHYWFTGWMANVFNSTLLLFYGGLAVTVLVVIRNM